MGQILHSEPEGQQTGIFDLQPVSEIDTRIGAPRWE